MGFHETGKICIASKSLVGRARRYDLIEGSFRRAKASVARAINPRVAPSSELEISGCSKLL